MIVPLALNVTAGIPPHNQRKGDSMADTATEGLAGQRENVPD